MGWQSGAGLQPPSTSTIRRILTAAGLFILRSAYDPAAAPALERHGELGRSLATAGPVGVNETWERVRTDSASTAVLWISEWPHSSVYPDFLRPLLLTSGV